MINNSKTIPDGLPSQSQDQSEVIAFLRLPSTYGTDVDKIGCAAQTLHTWVRQAERDQGLKAGPTSEERERLKQLERENRELRQANEILRKASAYFAQAELDRRSKT